MGPVFAVGTIFFAIEGASFIAVVCGLTALFCAWRFMALR